MYPSIKYLAIIKLIGHLSSLVYVLWSLTNSRRWTDAHLIYLFYFRPPKLSAVHSQHDCVCEEIPVAVHWVQVLWSVWHLWQWCKYMCTEGSYMKCCPWLNWHSILAFADAGSIQSCASMRLGCLVPANWWWFIKMSHL